MAVRSAGIASRLPSVLQRRSDTKTLEELKTIFESPAGPSTIIQRLSIVLKNSETVNSILICDDNRNKENSAPTSVSENLGNVLHDPGAPAECVTLDEILQRRKDAIAAKELEKAEKERRRERKEAERAKRKAEEEAKRMKASEARKQKRKQSAAHKEYAAHRKAAMKRQKLKQKQRKLMEQENRKKDRELIWRVVQSLKLQNASMAVKDTSKQTKTYSGRTQAGIRVCASLVVGLFRRVCDGIDGVEAIGNGHN